VGPWTTAAMQALDWPGQLSKLIQSAAEREASAQ